MGAAPPQRAIENTEVEARLGVTQGWIESRSGVRSRAVLDIPADLVGLAERACRAALDGAGLEPASLDAVVAATTSSPYQFPSLACLVHERLGMRRAPAFDVAAACAGFTYALAVADQGIRSGDYERVLVIGADCLSHMVEPTDAVTAPLFGDGAGAVVLAAEHGTATGMQSARGILACRLRAASDVWPILTLPAGARRREDFDREGFDPWMRMKGQEVFRFAVEQLVDLTREALAAAGLAVNDVAAMVPHQANLRIIRMMANQLGVSEDRIIVNLDRYGNTSAASIPLALADGVRDGRIRAGEIVVLNAVGGGMTAGAIVIRW